RISVLRDGSLVKNLEKDANVNLIVEHMVGRKIENIYPQKNEKIGKTIFYVHDLSGPKGIENINLTVKEGEIVGISGLMGSGQITLAKMLYGTDEINTGYIEVKGNKIKKMTPNK